MVSSVLASVSNSSMAKCMEGFRAYSLFTGRFLSLPLHDSVVVDIGMKDIRIPPLHHFNQTSWLVPESNAHQDQHHIHIHPSLSLPSPHPPFLPSPPPLLPQWQSIIIDPLYLIPILIYLLLINKEGDGIEWGIVGSCSSEMLQIKPLLYTWIIIFSSHRPAFPNPKMFKNVISHGSSFPLTPYPYTGNAASLLYYQSTHFCIVLPLFTRVPLHFLGWIIWLREWCMLVHLFSWIWIRFSGFFWVVQVGCSLVPWQT